MLNVSVIPGFDESWERFGGNFSCFFGFEEKKSFHRGLEGVVRELTIVAGGVMRRGTPILKWEKWMRYE